MKEKSITDAILRWLRSQPDVYAWKALGTSTGVGGLPDIVGNVGHVALYLEVKSPTGKVALRQRAVHQKIGESGGCVFVVRSLKEAQSVVRILRTQADPRVPATT